MAANTAVILELNEHSDAKQYTVAAATSISKGTLLLLSGDNTVVASTPGDSGKAFAGIAAADKDGTDSSTTLAVYTPFSGNKFDLTMAPVGALANGSAVCISGENTIRAAVAGDLLTGSIIGIAQEAGDTAEVIVVLS